MDTVFIQGLQVDAIIGIYDYERVKPQAIVLDIELAWNIDAAARDDNIEYALDYKKIADRVMEIAKQGEFGLVESLAQHIALALESEFLVQGSRVRVSKPDAIANAEAVGVQIKRGIPF